MNLTASQLASVKRVAATLGVPSDWILAVIRNESNGDPRAKNPRSSARGLIQFVDATAKSLGYDSSLDLVGQNPSFESQMSGPVLRYLSWYKPFPTFASLAGSVFYPAYRNKPNALLPDSVRAVNPFKTVQEYADSVWAKYKGIKIVEASLVPVALAGGLLWWYFRKRRLRSRS